MCNYLECMANVVAGLIALVCCLGMAGVAWWKITGGEYLSAIVAVAIALFLGWLAWTAAKNIAALAVFTEREVTGL